jgi:hypothetical protein
MRNLSWNLDCMKLPAWPLPVVVGHLVQERPQPADSRGLLVRWVVLFQPIAFYMEQFVAVAVPMVDQLSQRVNVGQEKF